MNAPPTEQPVKEFDWAYPLAHIANRGEVNLLAAAFRGSPAASREGGYLMATEGDEDVAYDLRFEGTTNYVEFLLRRWLEFQEADDHDAVMRRISAPHVRGILDGDMPEHPLAEFFKRLDNAMRVVNKVRTDLECKELLATRDEFVQHEEWPWARAFVQSPSLLAILEHDPPARITAGYVRSLRRALTAAGAAWRDYERS